MSEKRLCVNVDHIATLRQARGGRFPDPLEGARVCEDAGAHGITVHLREDRRHIQDRDVFGLKEIVRGTFNLEMALSDDIIALAKKVRPDQVTLVPERREELTTEGGLDVAAHAARIRETAAIFRDLGVRVSLFIEPERDAVLRSKDVGADFIEIHTGAYCLAADEAAATGRRKDEADRELERILKAAEIAVEIGIGVNAGHGLNAGNLRPVLAAPGLYELNIGHSIVARSVFVGLAAAVRELLDIIREST